MNAGRGVSHREFNHSPTDSAHLQQIWILPAIKGNRPEYDQKRFPDEERRNRLRLIASPSGEDGSIPIHQDARLLNVLLAPDARVDHRLEPGRHAWVHVATGRVRLGETELAAGDGAALSDEERLTLTGLEDSDVLVFDLA